METTTSPSFIPHDAKTAPRGTQGSGLSELLVLIAIVLVVASVALAVGVFLYQQYLQSSSTSKLAQLQTAEAAFEPSLIQQLTRLDDRMTSADQILQSHIAPSALFSMLEQTTITTISYQSLTFDATNPEQISIKMSGVADSVNSIALQSDLFSKSGMITSPIFSNIGREQDGVHFDFSALINPTSLNYLQLLNSGSVNQAPQTSPSTQVQTQTQTSQGAASSSASGPTQGNASPFGTAPAQGSAKGTSQGVVASPGTPGN